MTYSLAWKSDKSIFMAADTAITSSEELNIQKSSFGQKHYQDKNTARSVQESVVKFFLEYNIGLTFAGSYDLAISVAKSFYTEIIKNKSPLEALKWSLFLNPPTEDKNIQLAIGYFDGEPKLITYNSEHNSKIEVDKYIVQLGNPLEVHKRLSRAWIEDLINNKSYKDDLKLSAALGIFQSYNLFSPQMERGIGGAFCGLYIDKLGGHWQPDILFIEHGGNNSKLVSTCFRHDCLVINSPTIGQSRCFLSYLPPLDNKYIISQANKAIAKGKTLSNQAEFEYIVILNVEKVTIPLVEMNRNKKHGIIWIKRCQDGDRDGFEITMFPRMRELLKRDGPGLNIVHYWEPTVKKIPGDKIINRTISYN